MAPTKRNRSRKRSGKRASPAQRNQGTKRKTPETALQGTAKENCFEMKTMEDILKDGFGGTVEPQASAFLMGVMQYIATEIIELSGNAARENTPPDEPFTITPKDISKALQSDDELKQLFNGDMRKTKEKH